MRLLPHQLLLLLLGSTFCSSSSLSAPQLCLLPLGLPSAAFEPFLEPGPTHLDVGGEPVSLLDELGPLVVSKDGTLARISTWATMDEMERARVLRVLGNRNRKRLAALKMAHADAQVP